jgi:hypothetical protein
MHDAGPQQGKLLHCQAWLKELAEYPSFAVVAYPCFAACQDALQAMVAAQRSSRHLHVGRPEWRTSNSPELQHVTTDIHSAGMDAVNLKTGEKIGNVARNIMWARCELQGSVECFWVDQFSVGALEVRHKLYGLAGADCCTDLLRAHPSWY